MSPQHKTDVISGSPTLVNLSDDPKKELTGILGNEDIEKSEAVVLFINEESLSKSPLVGNSLGNNIVTWTPKGFLGNGSINTFP
jgi:hypothetical protein